jgi:hypothetical protein
MNISKQDLEVTLKIAKVSTLLQHACPMVREATALLGECLQTHPSSEAVTVAKEIGEATRTLEAMYKALRKLEDSSPG